MMDTYEFPSGGWTCFHCGENFTSPGTARDHFGADPSATPGCLIKVQLGAERGLLMALRKAEALIARYQQGDSDIHRKMVLMQIRHADALCDAEEAGYERGRRDARGESPEAGG